MDRRRRIAVCFAVILGKGMGRMLIVFTRIFYLKRSWGLKEGGGEDYKANTLGDEAVPARDGGTFPLR